VPEVNIGALCWNQYTDWPPFLEAGIRAESLGYDSLWTWDHLYPIVGSHEGPMFEAWLTLAAWAQRTERIRLGLMVGANTFRNPALVVKMATTLDHQSGGRVTLGLGAASSSATAPRIGSAGWPRRCRSSGACSAVRPRVQPDGTTGCARFATSRHPSSHRCRCSWAAAARESPSSSLRDTRTPATSAGAWPP
jgi:hypothetical protein